MSEAETFGAVAVRLERREGLALDGRARQVRALRLHAELAARRSPPSCSAPAPRARLTPDAGSAGRRDARGDRRSVGRRLRAARDRAALRGQACHRAAHGAGVAPRGALQGDHRVAPPAAVAPGRAGVCIDVKNLGELDEPLVLHMKLEMSSFARPRSGRAPGLAALPAAPGRAHPAAEPRDAALHLREHRHRLAVKLRIKLPEGARVTTALEPPSSRTRPAYVTSRITSSRGFLVLDRVMDLPAGRIQPAGYLDFQAFARRVDAALHRDISVTLGGH